MLESSIHIHVRSRRQRQMCIRDSIYTYLRYGTESRTLSGSSSRIMPLLFVGSRICPGAADVCLCPTTYWYVDNIEYAKLAVQESTYMYYFCVPV